MHWQAKFLFAERSKGCEALDNSRKKVLRRQLSFIHIWGGLLESLNHVISVEWFRLFLRFENKMAATAQLESLVSRLEQVTSRLEKVSVKGGGQGAVPGKYSVKTQATSHKAK